MKVAYPNDKFVLGRYLGPSTDIGPAMTAKIMKPNGYYAHRSSYRGLTQDEINDPKEKTLRDAFDMELESNLGPSAKRADFDIALDVEDEPSDLYEDDEQEAHQVPDRDDIPDNFYDTYLGAEVLLPCGDMMQTATVKRRKLSTSGDPIGQQNSNPILDTRVYQVEFPDGAEMEYAANLIAENMWAQCDVNGNQTLLMDAIDRHKSDDSAVQDSDGTFTLNGKEHVKKTTKGWSLCIQRKDGTTTWQ